MPASFSYDILPGIQDTLPAFESAGGSDATDITLDSRMALS